LMYGFRVHEQWVFIYITFTREFNRLQNVLQRISISAEERKLIIACDIVPLTTTILAKTKLTAIQVAVWFTVVPVDVVGVVGTTSSVLPLPLVHG
jgi:hypothetical protein